MNNLALFGMWLKERRRASGLTQEQLAKRVACSAALIRKIEAGERTPSPQLVQLLAGWLKIDANRREAFLSFANGALDAQDAERQFGRLSPLGAPTTASHPTNLPTPLTRLIGRERELQAAHDLLIDKDVRLLTLTGPPGTGKTRLAMQVAAQLAGQMADGIFFVPLAPVNDPEIVGSTVVEVLGVKVAAGESPSAALKRYLRSKQSMLVLDNFEQILDAAPVVVDLLSGCPYVKVLVTSREPLHTPGEHRFHVPPLALPDLAHLPELEACRAYPAIALFEERARAIEPRFAVTQENRGSVAAICALLGGLPLAIELAAARIALLSPAEIEAHVRENRFRLLGSAAQHLSPKHQTLRGAIDWSYNLLEPGESRLFRRLGAFVGGYTLAAASAVCDEGQSDANGHLPAGYPPLGVLGDLAALIDKNLLQRESPASPAAPAKSRYTMLEVIHEYALEKLDESGEADTIHKLHADYYLAFAEPGESTLSWPDKRRAWLGQIEGELGNLRAALEWSLAGGRVETAARLGVALWPFWHSGRYRSEGARWLAQVLATLDSIPNMTPGGYPPNGGDRVSETPEGQSKSMGQLRAGVLCGAGVLARNLGNEARAEELLKESLTLRRHFGERLETAETLIELAHVLVDRGEFAQAEKCAEESVTIWRTWGEKDKGPVDGMLGLAVAVVNLAHAALSLGSYAHAADLYAQGISMARHLGAKELIAYAMNGLGLTAQAVGDYARSTSVFEESLALSRELNLPGVLQLDNLSTAAIGLGDYARATTFAMQVLAFCQETGHRRGATGILIDFAAIAVGKGYPDDIKQLEGAARLFGASEALHEAMGVIPPNYFGDATERHKALARTQLGEEVFLAEVAKGRTITLEQATALALALGGTTE